jgi:hypothetical protein
MGQPDPLSDHMLEYVDVLRASHAAAMDDAEKQD